MIQQRNETDGHRQTDERIMEETSVIYAATIPAPVAVSAEPHTTRSKGDLIYFIRHRFNVSNRDLDAMSDNRAALVMSIISWRCQGVLAL